MRTREEIARHLRLIQADEALGVHRGVTVEELLLEALLDIRDELGALRGNVAAVEGALDGVPMDRR